MSNFIDLQFSGLSLDNYDLGQKCVNIKFTYDHNCYIKKDNFELSKFESRNFQYVILTQYTANNSINISSKISVQLDDYTILNVCLDQYESEIKKFVNENGDILSYANGVLSFKCNSFINFIKHYFNK